MFVLLYYPLILLSIVGYGAFFSKKVLSIDVKNFGYFGLLGIFFLLLVSYISSQFLAHNYIFNTIVIFIGLMLFFFFRNNIFIEKNDIKLLILLLSISAIFILVGKNHDDFEYYHFPYILILTEFPHPIGLGSLNHGFKTHSSMFFLSSLFSLPKAKYTLFHLGPAFILVFFNFIILKNILNKELKKQNKFLIYFCLSSFIFVNIFFYRLSEHGTDRSAMILIILLIYNILHLMNKKDEDKDSLILKIIFVLFSIIASLKTFYLIYILILFPLIPKILNNRNLIKSSFSINTFFCFLLISFVLLTNILNTGCVLFPERRTCFFNLSWSLEREVVEYLKLHYENWAKAGSGAGYNILDTEKKDYISGLNWLSNWVEKYFFNKVSDLIYSLFFLGIVLFSSFKSDKLNNIKSRNYKFLYFLLLLIFTFWFVFHPALRYGGYHLFFLILFIPLSLILEKYDEKNFNLKIKVIIILTIIIFFARNIDRLKKENKIYNYNPFIKLEYNLKDSLFRYQKKIYEDIKQDKIKSIYKNRYIF